MCPYTTQILPLTTMTTRSLAITSYRPSLSLGTSAVTVRTWNLIIGFHGAERTLERVYQAAGSVVDNAVAKISHKFGLGPMTTAKEIEALLGNDASTIQARLEELHHALLNGSSYTDRWMTELSDLCSYLVKYAEP